MDDAKVRNATETSAIVDGQMWIRTRQPNCTWPETSRFDITDWPQ